MRLIKLLLSIVMFYVLEPDFLFQKVYCFPRITVKKKKNTCIEIQMFVFILYLIKKTDFKPCKMTIIVKEKTPAGEKRSILHKTKNRATANASRNRITE